MDIWWTESSGELGASQFFNGFSADKNLVAYGGC